MVLVPIHALESEGVNEIPMALAEELSRRLGLPVHDGIVQVNSVGHTGADGFTRLANQALFDGPVLGGFGFGFECLARSEARYLEKTADADTIRSRVAAAGSAGGA